MEVRIVTPQVPPTGAVAVGGQCLAKNISGRPTAKASDGAASRCDLPEDLQVRCTLTACRCPCSDYSPALLACSFPRRREFYISFTTVSTRHRQSRSIVPRLRGRAQESFDAPVVLRKVVLPAGPLGGILPLFLTATPGRATVEIRNHLASFLNEP